MELQLLLSIPFYSIIYSVIVLSIPIIYLQLVLSVTRRGGQIASINAKKVEMLNDISFLWLKRGWLDLFIP